MTETDRACIDRCAEENGWTVTDEGDLFREYIKDNRVVHVWFGPKGRVSGAQSSATSVRSGRRVWNLIDSPRMRDKVMEVLAS